MVLEYNAYGRKPVNLQSIDCQVVKINSGSIVCSVKNRIIIGKPRISYCLEISSRVIRFSRRLEYCCLVGVDVIFNQSVSRPQKNAHSWMIQRGFIFPVSMNSTRLILIFLPVITDVTRYRGNSVCGDAFANSWLNDHISAFMSSEVVGVSNLPSSLGQLSIRCQVVELPNTLFAAEMYPSLKLPWWVTCLVGLIYADSGQLTRERGVG